MIIKNIENSLGIILNKYIYIIIFVLILIIFYPTSLNIFTHTFNFADNFGYAKSIELLKMSISEGIPYYIGKDVFFIGEDYKILFITPLWQILGLLLSYLVPTITAINIIILLSIYLNILCSYILFKYISKDKFILSFLGAIIFGASSLVLYTVWFNLMGLFFIPLIVLYFLKYIKNNKKQDLLFFSILFFLITLSNTYFITIILLILFSFYIVYINKNKKKIIMLFFINIIIIICAFNIYKIPFKKLELYSHPVKMEKLLNTIKINSHIDLFRIFIPNNNNIYSKEQLNITKKIYNGKIKYYRYSFYLPIIIIIFIILIFSLIFINKIPLNKNTKVGIYISFFSLILFLGDKIVINGFDLGIKNILYYIKLLPNGEILRKSVYFFYPLTFGISLIIVGFFTKNYKNKYNFLFLILAIFILLMNIGPYYGKSFKIIRENNIIKRIPENSNILSLPNSSYNNWELEYYLLHNNNRLNFFEFGNATLKNYKEYQNKLQDNNLFLYNLIYNKGNYINKGYCNLSPYKLDYIILNKNYITNFFGYSNKTKIYYNILDKMKLCENINILSENNDIILYKIKK